MGRRKTRRTSLGKTARAALVGIGFVRFDHTNFVVGELEVRSGYLVLRHVAGDAQSLADAASVRDARLRSVSPSSSQERMASQTFGVEGSRVGLVALVGIVARQAPDAGIALVIAPAQGQPVRLESDIDHADRQSLGLHQRHGRPRPMTGAAKLCQVACAQFVRVQDVQILELAGVDCLDVLCTRTVAGFTTHTGNQGLDSQAGSADGARRMTAEALPHLVRGQLATRSFVGGFRLGNRVAKRPIKALGIIVEADPAFIMRTLNT